jgi:hypothetical protein
MVEVDAGGEVIAGQVITDHGEPAAFVGWLQFIAAIDSALSFAGPEVERDEGSHPGVRPG